MRSLFISGSWAAARADGATSPGVTLAIAPIGTLIAADGVLARLRAQGVVVEGP